MNIDVAWTGPYGWPKFEAESGLPPLPKHSGVYLQTVEYQDGYIIYAAGLTRRPFKKRFAEHTRNYIRGEYNILDIHELRHGIRKKIWQGWGWTSEKRVEFAARQTELFDAVRQQMAGFRMFVADVDIDGRIPERLEAAVMNFIYAADAPFCDVADRGMQLTPRWPNEEPIMIRATCDKTLHGLPRYFEI